MGRELPGSSKPIIARVRAVMGEYPRFMRASFRLGGPRAGSTTSDSGYGWALGVKVRLEIGNTNDITLTRNGHRCTFYFAPAVECSAFTRRTTPRSRCFSAACKCPTSSLVEFGNLRVPSAATRSEEH